MSNVKGFAAIVSALVFCPCHLALFSALFAGTAISSTIAEHYDVLIVAAGLYFVVALAAGVRWMTQHSGADCATCEAAAEPSVAPHAERARSRGALTQVCLKIWSPRRPEGPA